MYNTIILEVLIVYDPVFFKQILNSFGQPISLLKFFIWKFNFNK